MVTVARPEFVPDPSLSRAGMEALQREIAGAARFEDDPPIDPLRPDADDDPDQATLGDRGPVVVGVDQAFAGERAVSALVAMRGGRVIERTHAVAPLSIDYVPGLLSFREGGPILEAFRALDAEPDLALFDGSGRIHFREAGLATHIGVVLDLPSVGVAKRLLCGRPRSFVEDLPEGARVGIVADGRVDAPEGTLLGYAVQTRQYEGSRRINPVYVSPGHRVSAESAADHAEALCAGYKLPEPIRLADRYADEVKTDLE